MKWFQTVALGLSILVTTGCASTSNQQWLYPPMAVPLQASMQQEVQIARLSQLLTRPDLSDELRAKMLFERGNYYDSVGLRDLARLDYSQSLQLNPSQSDLFNALGVYYTQVGEFDAAYEAFDSTLDLNPDNSFAVRNRAIALYYGDRIDLAIEDIDSHLADDPSDPFRALWAYLIKLEKDPLTARQDLLSMYQQRDNQWGWVLVAISLGEVSDEQAFKAIIAGTRDNTVLAQRLTEAYFYLGKRYQHEGNLVSAISMYKLAISFNVYEYVEHRYSFLELKRIFTQIKADQIAKAKLDAPTQP
ncbi:lipoprotein NlpI [Vibrio renipiscarius]|uniref:Lipoprotein NlpI n=1 Tax=Vibrio renipiscarius TaxID=1461322 RepID=A0A0C2KD81_9VIBR|nr:lipoprotein NlpI [Vibrio renipiscarius]KII79948.1 lipoprotein NlpI [Vibrio renipiscarius]KII80078.1 lipoprotein NlpI [Vibrio renipiscarius]